MNLFSRKTIYRMYMCLQQQLREAREGLKAASRLSEQLEKKDEQIERLNEEGNYYHRLHTSDVACILFLVYGMITVFRLNRFMHHEKQLENDFCSHHDISHVFFHISAFILTHCD